MLKIFQFQRELCPWTPARGSAPAPRWGHSKRLHVRRQQLVKQPMIRSTDVWHSYPVFDPLLSAGRLRFLLTNIYAATIKIYCNVQATAIATSTSATLQMIDRHSLYYRPTFFHPPVNRTMFPAFHRPVYPPIYRLVGPVLKTHCFFQLGERDRRADSLMMTPT